MTRNCTSSIGHLSRSWEMCLPFWNVGIHYKERLYFYANIAARDSIFDCFFVHWKILLCFAKYNSVESGSGVFFNVSIFCYHKYKSGSFTWTRKQGKTKKTNKGNKDTNGIPSLQSLFTNTQNTQIQNHKIHKYKSGRNKKAHVIRYFIDII